LKELDGRVKEAIELHLEAGGKDMKISELVAVKKIHIWVNGARSFIQQKPGM
jgi:hypothetical protein